MRSVVKPVILAFVVLGAAAVAAQQTTPTGQTPPAGQSQSQATAPRRPASPAGTAATQVAGKWVPVEKPGAAPRYQDGKWIEITYGRPILRGRENVFGSGAEYGKVVSTGSTVWRAGANVTTRMTTEVPLVFAGKTLPAGEYSMFVDLKADAWTLIFSKQPYQQKYDPQNKTATWGSYSYDAAQDVLRVPMTLAKSPYSVDQFTIGFVDMTQQGGKLAMWWDKEFATAAFTVGSL